MDDDDFGVDALGDFRLDKEAWVHQTFHQCPQDTYRWNLHTGLGFAVTPHHIKMGETSIFFFAVFRRRSLVV